MANRGSTSRSFMVFSACSSPGWGKPELQHADEFVLVIDRRHDHIAHALGEEVGLNAGAVIVGLQVFDNQELAVFDRAFVDGADKSLDAILRRIRPDSAILDARGGIEHQDLMVVKRR